MGVFCLQNIGIIVLIVSRQSIQSDEAYRRLRPMLLHGQIQPGVRLRETEWASRLGVHRGALREAFSLLAHEGLLRPGARGGHFVPALERADLDEVLELRASLETGAVYQLARRGVPVDVSGLCVTCNTMHQLLDQGMHLGFAEADRRFHEQIVELSGNSRMIRAYQHAPILITAALDAAESRHLSFMRTTVAEHEAICDRLEAVDFFDAARLLETHLFTAHSRHTEPIETRNEPLNPIHETTHESE